MFNNQSAAVLRMWLVLIFCQCESGMKMLLYEWEYLAGCMFYKWHPDKSGQAHTHLLEARRCDQRTFLCQLRLRSSYSGDQGNR